MATQNTGFQGYFILKEINLSNGADTGYKKPNLQSNSPQALVLNAATITYNYPTDVAPSGGANGDIWYNPVADHLYKKISGTWTLLTDRVTDPDYVSPTDNEVSCPIPSAITKNILLYAQYGLTILGLLNSTTTGIPGTLASVSVTPGNTLTDHHNGITAGNAQLVISGTATPAGHVRAYLKVGGTVIYQSPSITSSAPVTIVFNNNVASSQNVEVGLELF